MRSNRLAILKFITVITTCFTLLVITLGAYTRLVDAGLGCPDWPTCYGHLWGPEGSFEVKEANSNFPLAPVDLAKTWPEMTHRYLAASLGLFCLIIFALSWSVHHYKHSKLLKHASLLICLVILQGMFGMWTVTLKLWPQVVTLHLLGGFLTFSLLLLFYLRLSPVKLIPANKKLKTLAAFCLALTLCQVALGGWVSSNYAALACLQLPLCSMSGLSSNDFIQGFNLFQQIGPNYLGGQLDATSRVAIHASHRLGAVLVLITITALATSLARKGCIREAIVLFALLSVQILLGMANIYFHLPLYNAVAHNLGGAILVGFLIYLNYRLSSNFRAYTGSPKKDC
ncbi:MAG: COX15/CtaA family protein [Litorilituus sp.]|jgi:cytochrome c oxidase assembly protein subunit 15|nr:COX15/CtaA family protein [Litorilituus sp.]